VCGGDQGLGLCAVDAWQADGQVGCDAEASLQARPDADRSGYFRIGRDRDLRVLARQLERAVEAGGIAGGEQLFRIDAFTTRAAQFLWRRELNVEAAI
jgi:hypothetical protein